MLFNLLLITLAFGVIIYLELPGLWSKKCWRQLAAFSVLLIPAMIYSYGIILDADLPNPSRFIETLFEPLAVMLDNIMRTEK